MPKTGKTVLVIPDLQCPFQHPDALAFCIWVKRQFGPIDEIVCIGDEADQHAVSDYPADPDGLSAGIELHKCIEELMGFYKAFPVVKVCTSNHTDRIFRKALKHGIPRAYLRQYRDFLDAPKGWVWKDQWTIDGVIYEHGHALSGGSGRQASYQLPLLNRRSTVFGHFHSFAGIQYLASDELGVHFGFNVGCLIDQSAYVFQYGKRHKQKPILGCGIVEDGVPEFIPMRLTKGGRWVGSL